jgi:hypothetical protein
MDKKSIGNPSILTHTNTKSILSLLASNNGDDHFTSNRKEFYDQDPMNIFDALEAKQKKKANQPLEST